jgi:hypothetical protein
VIVDSEKDAALGGEPPAEWVPLDSLVPFEGNPRRNDKTVPIVAASIRRFGWGAPMVARRANRTILAGHARRGAALLLTEQWANATTRERQAWHPDAVRVATKREVVVRFKDIDEHDAALYLVADNRIGEEHSETDDEQLAALVDELQGADVDLLDGTGLTDEAIKELLGEAAPAGDGDVTGGDPGEGRYREQFGVIVVCTGEAEQQQVYEQLKGEFPGSEVRVVTT